MFLKNFLLLVECVGRRGQINLSALQSKSGLRISSPQRAHCAYAQRVYNDLSSLSMDIDHQNLISHTTLMYEQPLPSFPHQRLTLCDRPLRGQPMPLKTQDIREYRQLSLL